MPVGFILEHFGFGLIDARGLYSQTIFPKVLLVICLLRLLETVQFRQSAM
jgi:hypothetical protein